MLNMCLLSVITVLSVFGIYFLVKEAASFLLKNRINSRVVLEIHDDVNSAEAAIRGALRANPESEIEIIDKSRNAEINEILALLARSVPRVHIKNVPEE